MYVCQYLALPTPKTAKDTPDIEGLSSLIHDMNLVALSGGCPWYDDTKTTTVVFSPFVILPGEQAESSSWVVACVV